MSLVPRLNFGQGEALIPVGYPIIAEGLACEEHTEQRCDAVDEESADAGWQGVPVLL